LLKNSIADKIVCLKQEYDSIVGKIDCLKRKYNQDLTEVEVENRI